MKGELEVKMILTAVHQVFRTLQHLTVKKILKRHFSKLVT